MKAEKGVNHLINHNGLNHNGYLTVVAYFFDIGSIFSLISIGIFS